MPHECQCRTCGAVFPILADPLDAANIGQFNREQGAKTLAMAIMKIAPEEAKKIAKRWEEILTEERQALDDFITALRATP